MFSMSMCKSFLEFSNTQFLDWAVAVSPHQKRYQSHPLNYKLSLEPKFKDSHLVFWFGHNHSSEEKQQHFSLSKTIPDLF